MLATDFLLTSYGMPFTLYFMNQARPTFSCPHRPERSVGWDKETGFQKVPHVAMIASMAISPERF
jgi:hypothetical protein